ncbi:MAG: hypothetical protein UY21_C0001G0040 [Microgenomates group bacterium GW2011_GWA1_48_10]|nr:MAG: hypothetical protein UY21_C0001G0040 [Microgenomates group bacterium GW2011_GWA1_48_10]
MTLIQLLLSIFLLFALSRVILRFRGGQLSPLEFAFWSILFVAAIFGIFLPEQTSQLAKILGIGRGADLVVYVSIVIIFYLVFRLYIMIENLRHEITEIVRKIALENVIKSKTKK